MKTTQPGQIRAWPEEPKRTGLIGVETVSRGEDPGSGEKNTTAALAARSTAVRPHPTGGFTHARPAGGTCCVYVGWWRTRRAAVRSLAGGGR